MREGLVRLNISSLCRFQRANPKGICGAFEQAHCNDTMTFTFTCQAACRKEMVSAHIPIIRLVLIRLAPLCTTACGLWVAAGYPVREVSGGGHRCPKWRRHVLDKAIVVGADRMSRH